MSVVEVSHAGSLFEARENSYTSDVPTMQMSKNSFPSLNNVGLEKNGKAFERYAFNSFFSRDQNVKVVN